MENNNELSAFDKMRQWISTSITIKLLSIGFIMLLLLIPLSSINDIVRERAYRKNDAVAEVSSKWGNEQCVQALVLSVPYEYIEKKSLYTAPGQAPQFEEIIHSSVMNFYPDRSMIKGTVVPTIKKRGIYEVPVYSVQLDITGDFIKPDEKNDFPSRCSKVLWEKASAKMFLNDLSSLEEQVNLNLAGVNSEFNPKNTGAGIAALTADLDLSEIDGDKLSFKTELAIRGTQSLWFTPLAKTAEVSLESSWMHPKFSGSFLPTHNIDESGFEANWKVLHLNRSLAQTFESESANQEAERYSFGVELYTPVDNYQSTERSTKYAMLLITLSFALFFFVQILMKIKIHPVQFMLVGLSLCVFYTLLLALSEHISFFKSYLIAASAITILNTMYVHLSFKKKTLSLLTFVVLSVLYAYIFSTLRMEDLALLAGSIGIFTALALIMFITRNFDWYTLKTKTA